MTYYFRESKSHHVIGDFWGGKNAPIDAEELKNSYLKPEKTHQIELNVGTVEQKRGVKIGCQEVLFQFMIDCSGADLTCRRHHYVQYGIGYIQVQIRLQYETRITFVLIYSPILILL